MVRAGGSASRIIGDQCLIDPGGGVGRRPPSWQLPVGRGLGSHWAPDTQAFLSLGSQSKADRGRMIESVWTALKGCWEVGADWCRSLQLRWMEAPGRWFPRGSELEGVGGGCGRLEGLGHVLLG